MVNGVLVPSPHPYPQLSDQRRVVRKEGINRGYCLGCPAATVLLKTRLDLSDECSDTLLRTVPNMEYRKTGVNKLPGLRRDPCLTDAFYSRWIGYRPADICEQTVRVARGSRCPEGKAALVTKVACEFSRWCSTEIAQDQLMIYIVAHISDRQSPEGSKSGSAPLVTRVACSMCTRPSTKDCDSGGSRRCPPGQWTLVPR